MKCGLYDVSYMYAVLLTIQEQCDAVQCGAVQCGAVRCLGRYCRSCDHGMRLREGRSATKEAAKVETAGTRNKSKVLPLTNAFDPFSVNYSFVK